MIRLEGGYFSAPLDGAYEARLLLDTDLSAMDVVAWQTTVSGSGPGLGGGIGLGIGPTLELAVGAAWLGGTYRTDMGEQIGVDSAMESRQEETPNSSLLVHADLRVAPGPERSARPVFGVGPAWFRGSSVRGHSDVAFQDFPAFSAPSRLGVHLLGGVEARLAQRLDAYAQVPMFFLFSSGTTFQAPQTDLIDDFSLAPTAGSFGAGLQVGLQVRLGG